MTIESNHSEQHPSDPTSDAYIESVIAYTEGPSSFGDIHAIDPVVEQHAVRLTEQRDFAVFNSIHAAVKQRTN